MISRAKSRLGKLSASIIDFQRFTRVVLRHWFDRPYVPPTLSAWESGDRPEPSRPGSLETLPLIGRVMKTIVYE